MTIFMGNYIWPKTPSDRIIRAGKKNEQMRKSLPSILLAFFFLPAFSQQVQTPDQIYGALFKDVQMAQIFPDGKTFVDCVPKKDPKEIVKDYLAAKNNPSLR